MAKLHHVFPQKLQRGLLSFIAGLCDIGQQATALHMVKAKGQVRDCCFHSLRRLFISDDDDFVSFVS